jgi:hypothetical protein
MNPATGPSDRKADGWSRSSIGSLTSQSGMDWLGTRSRKEYKMRTLAVSLRAGSGILIFAVVY